MEYIVDKKFMQTVKIDNLNSLDLRSDLENNNIYGATLVPEGYIGNRPSTAVGHHEDDTWAIDVDSIISYLYTSELEYNQDLETLKGEISKPKFYQAKLEEVEGNVIDHVYPHNKGVNQETMTDRMGSEEAICPDCGKNHWIILAEESCAVTEGGKPYIECMGCGYLTHL